MIFGNGSSYYFKEVSHNATVLFGFPPPFFFSFRHILAFLFKKWKIVIWLLLVC